MKLDKSIVGKIIKYFREKEIIAVYLYGSYVKNQATNDSDIDIAVLIENDKKKRLENMSYAEDLSSITKKEIDVSFLGRSLDFDFRVISEGKIVFSKSDKKRIEFEEKTIKYYFDIKPSLEEYYDSLKNIAKKGEFNVRYI